MTTPGDLAVGAFSDNPPWQIRPETLAWRDELGDLRDAARAEVPALMRRRLLPPLGRFVITAIRLSRALITWWLFDRRKGAEISGAGLSRRLREAFEALGPTYIKLGQIISSGHGLFPQYLVDEFKRCRDRVPAGIVRHGPRGRRGRSRPIHRGGLQQLRTHAVGRGVDRPGAPCHASYG